jgi:hypothetical protein
VTCGQQDVGGQRHKRGEAQVGRNLQVIGQRKVRLA